MRRLPSNPALRTPKPRPGRLVSATSLLPAALVALATTVAEAQTSVQTAVRADGPIDSTVWQAASPADGFKQREPNEGAEPSQRTEFRVAYDATTFHVRVQAFDTEPDKIVGYLTRRDEDSPSDWIHILVDSYHDRRTAYEFAVNPAGVKRDRYWFNDDNDDEGWDAVWDVTVAREPGGWSAEFHIPLSQLRYKTGEAGTFGLAVTRTIGRLNETSTWPLLARSATGYVSLFGELTGLAMTASPKRLELTPYTVGAVTRHPSEGNPLVDPTDPGAKAGLDMKYALTSGLTLTTTINPDFGQVEADPAVVNLSAFETFFDERRAFFVEGSSAFRFDSDCLGPPCRTLYSRRIGRAPQGELPSGDEVHTQAPLQTTILGAAKVTGRMGPFAIGVMQALTGEETGAVLDKGLRFEHPVEPLTSYTVARVRRDFANQSAVGGIVTYTRRRQTEQLRTLLADTAMVGGLDWDLRFRRSYSVTGYWAGSNVQGTSEAISELQQTSRRYFQRPDATSFELDESRTDLNGSSGRVGIGKIGGSRLRFNANVGYMSPGWELNDLGYLQRADQRWTSNWLQLRNETPTRTFRQRYLNFNHWSSWNADGDTVANGSNINGNVEFVNNWRVGGGVGRDWMFFDDRLTRGGPGGLSGEYSFFWSFLETDDRKPVAVELSNGAGWDGNGTWHRDHEIEVTYRPTAALELTPGIEIGRQVRDNQWIEEVQDEGTPRYVFGHLDQTTVSFTARVNYTMSPTLSLQLYAEPFVSGGGYSGFQELVDGRNRDYQGRYAPFAYTGDNPDFNVRSFRTTNVLRWEFKPGSTVFVVWQQAREGDGSRGDFQFGRDFGGVFRAPARNVFLVKMSYWMNY